MYNSKRKYDNLQWLTKRQLKNKFKLLRDKYYSIYDKFTDPTHPQRKRYLKMEDNIYDEQIYILRLLKIHQDPCPIDTWKSCDECTGYYRRDREVFYAEKGAYIPCDSTHPNVKFCEIKRGVKQ